jgi:hypothetical protein
MKTDDPILERLDRIENLLRQALNPAMTLPVEEKAEAVRKALLTGDKTILKQTLRRINGE